MFKATNKNHWIKASLLTAALAATVSISQSFAGTVSLTSDQFTVSGGTPNNPTVAASGLVATVANIPTATVQGSLTFGFGITPGAATDAPADGAYTFEVGMFIDHDGSQRRLEFFIPGLTLNFSGGAYTTGSVAAGSSVTTHGRSADGSATLSATLSNGILNVNSTSISLSAGNQLTEISGAGGILADIVNTFTTNTQGHYNYSVMLRQTGGPAALTFQAASTNLKCADASQFLLNGKGATFSGATQLVGEFSVQGATDADSNDPTLPTSACSPTFTAASGGGGGGGGDTTPPALVCPAGQALNAAGDACIVLTQDQQISNELNALASVNFSDVTQVTDAVKTQVSGLVTTASSNADTVATALTGGTATVTQGIAAIETISSVLNVSGNLNTQGGTSQTATSLVGTLEAASKVIGALTTGGALSSSQIATVQSSAQTLVSNTANNISGTLSDSDSASVAASLSNTIQNVLKVGGKLTTDFVSSMQSAAKNLTSSARQSLEAKFPQLAQNAAQSESLLVSAQVSLDVQATCDSNFRELSLIELYDVFIKADVVAIDGCSASSNSASLSRVFNPTKSAENLMAAAIGGTTSVVDVPLDQRTDITVDGALFPTRIINGLVVSDDFQNGARFLADGSAILVQDSIAFVAAPSAKDFGAFTSALASSFGATASPVDANGSFLLETAGLKASVAFAFEPVGASSGGSGTVSFNGPSGGPADPGYKYSIQYADGSIQSFTPYVAEPTFLRFMANSSGKLGTVDRATGVITFDDGSKLKADYFVGAFTESTQVYLNNNDSDGDGIVLASVPDVDGDGTADYQLISSAGTQTLYTVP